jgi:hypothetical protein
MLILSLVETGEIEYLINILAELALENDFLAKALGR